MREKTMLINMYWRYFSIIYLIFQIRSMLKDWLNSIRNRQRIKVDFKWSSCSGQGNKFPGRWWRTNSIEESWGDPSSKTMIIYSWTNISPTNDSTSSSARRCSCGWTNHNSLIPLIIDDIYLNAGSSTVEKLTQFCCSRAYLHDFLIRGHCLGVQLKRINFL